MDSSELLAATSSGSNCMKRRQLQMSLAEDSIPAVATAADPVVAATAPVVLAADPEPEQVVATAELAPAAVPASPVASPVAAAVPPPPPPAAAAAAAAVPAAVAAVPVAPVVPVAAPVTAPVAPVAPVAAAVAVAPSDASKLLQQIFDEIEKLSRVHGIFDADADGTVSAADLVAIAKG